MKKLNSMEELFAPFTSAPKNVKYRFVEEYSSTVTRQQALEDLDEFIYLMESIGRGEAYNLRTATDRSGTILKPGKPCISQTCAEKYMGRFRETLLTTIFLLPHL